MQRDLPCAGDDGDLGAEAGEGLAAFQADGACPYDRHAAGQLREVPDGRGREVGRLLQTPGLKVQSTRFLPLARHAAERREGMHMHNPQAAKDQLR